MLRKSSQILLDTIVCNVAKKKKNSENIIKGVFN